MARVGVAKGGPKLAPSPPTRASFVLGSRPPALRDFPIQRTVPVDNPSRQYGKKTQDGPFSGLGSGNTFTGG